MMHDGIETD